MHVGLLTRGTDGTTQEFIRLMEKAVVEDCKSTQIAFNKVQLFDVVFPDAFKHNIIPLLHDTGSSRFPFNKWHWLLRLHKYPEVENIYPMVRRSILYIKRDKWLCEPNPRTGRKIILEQI